MRRVILESPYAGNVEENIKYARACVLDSLMRDEAPLASHLLYTQEGILRDAVPKERRRGILAGHKWLVVAEAVVVYTDRGLSPGMKQAIAGAKELNIPIEYRSLYVKSGEEHF